MKSFKTFLIIKVSLKKEEHSNQIKMPLNISFLRRQSLNSILSAAINRIIHTTTSTDESIGFSNLNDKKQSNPFQSYLNHEIS